MSYKQSGRENDNAPTGSPEVYNACKFVLMHPRSLHGVMQNVTEQIT